MINITCATCGLPAKLTPGDRGQPKTTWVFRDARDCANGMQGRAIAHTY